MVNLEALFFKKLQEDDIFSSIQKPKIELKTIKVAMMRLGVNSRSFLRLNFARVFRTLTEMVKLMEDKMLAKV